MATFDQLYHEQLHNIRKLFPAALDNATSFRLLIFQNQKKNAKIDKY